MQRCKNWLNQTTGDSYTMVTSCAASTRRSSVGLSVRSLVNQALRGLQSPLLAEPGALAPGSECANAVWFDLVSRVDSGFLWANRKICSRNRMKNKEC